MFLRVFSIEDNIQDKF